MTERSECFSFSFLHTNSANTHYKQCDVRAGRYELAHYTLR